jgi:hypothetical protein
MLAAIAAAIASMGQVGGGGPPAIENPNVVVRVVPFTISTSTGDVDITGDLYGLTPKAAQFFVVGHDPANNPGDTDDGRVSFGITDGVRSWYNGMTSQHAQAIAVVATVSNNNAVIGLPTPGSTTLDMAATFVQWLPDGVRINVSDAPAAVVSGICILWAGPDVTAHVANADMGTGTSAVTLSGILGGKTPELIFAYTGNLGLSTDATWARFSFGIATASQQFGMGANETPLLQSGLHTGTMFAVYDNNDVLSQVNNTNLANGAVNYQIDIGNFAEGAFDFTPSASAGSDHMGYLALNLNGHPISLSREDSPDDGVFGDPASPKAVTTPGFEPQGVFVFHTTSGSAWDTGGGGSSIQVANGSQSQWSFGFADLDQEASVDIMVKNLGASGSTGDGPSVTKSNAKARVVNLGEAIYDSVIWAELASFDATGYTLDYFFDNTDISPNGFANFLSLSVGLPTEAIE